uniref:Uncharacterized protein n=1 Tax=Cacopsylla melanoneura TaxID=428564 RepID=A0A8D8U927_9HEMI
MISTQDNKLLNCNYINEWHCVKDYNYVNDYKPEIKFKIADSLNQVQRSELLSLLHEFIDIFAGPGEIPTGNFRMKPATIDLTDDVPVSRPPYRNAHKERPIIETEVNKMAKAGVIRSS